MTNSEAAWLAGIYCGEGSAGLYTTRKKRKDGSVATHPSPQLSVSNNDLELLGRVRELFGFGEINLKNKVPRPNCELQYTWDVYARPRIAECISIMWPYLSQEKKQQVAGLITFLKTAGFEVQCESAS